MRRKNNYVSAYGNLSLLTSLFSGSWPLFSPPVSTHILLHSICQWALSRESEEKASTLAFPYIYESTPNKDGDGGVHIGLSWETSAPEDFHGWPYDQSAENIILIFALNVFHLYQHFSGTVLVCIENVRFTVVLIFWHCISYLTGLA